MATKGNENGRKYLTYIWPMIGVLITFLGSIFIPRVVPVIYQTPVSISLTVAIIFSVIYYALVIYGGIRREDRQALAENAAYQAVKSYKDIMMYRFVPDKGGFYYGEVRNVIARVETIQTIVKEFMKITPKGKKKILRNIGRSVGRSFAKDLAEQVLPGKGINTHHLSKELLDLWHEYDYRAGFANLDFTKFDIDTLTGVISNEDHFLLYRRYDEKLNLCSFFDGYVEAVLEFFNTKKVSVRRDCVNRKHHICKLRVQLVISP